MMLARGYISTGRRQPFRGDARECGVRVVCRSRLKEGRAIAPPRIYPLPLEQLNSLLHQARARGLTFEEAWDEAIRPGRAIVMTTTVAAPVTAIRWPTDRTDRLAWQEAVLATEPTWRRAYEQTALSRGERALLELGESFSRVDVTVLQRLASIPSGAAIPSAA